jgi:hypothetical protein
VTTPVIGGAGSPSGASATIKTEEQQQQPGASATSTNAPSSALGALASAETLAPSPAAATTPAGPGAAPATTATTTTPTANTNTNTNTNTNNNATAANTATPTAAVPANNSNAAAAGQTQGGASAELSEEEQRKKQEELRRLELEFTQLKEKFFNEKLTGLKREIESLTAGTHDLFLSEVKHLEERRNKKLLLAEYWRKFHARCVDIYTESEKKTADDEFQSETKDLHDRMMKNIVKKRKQLEDEKRDLILNVTENSNDSQQGGNSRATRTLRKRGKESADGSSGGGLDRDAPPKKPNTPDIRVMLTDEEVEHDIMIILRGQLPSAL